MRNQLSIAVIMVLITGCQKSYDSGLVKYDPPMLNTCDSYEVTVKWNMSTIQPAVGSLYVYVVGVDKKEHLFAEGGAVGEAKTGPWAQANKTKFVLKNKESKEILYEGQIDGPGCQ